MAIERIGNAGVSPSPERTRTASPVRFEVRHPARPAPVPARLEVEPRRALPASQHRVDPGAWLGRVAAAQARMDRILALAASGRTFSPAELLSLQAGVAEASQTVDLAGKVLDRVSGGVRTLLQTQV
ncbi:MAG TPA: ATP-dependent helicase HrpB [Myxococcaceae bacterium]|nr:ATP-dependent helicase HrpB [Myxococcaceae bacterium]